MGTDEECVTKGQDGALLDLLRIVDMGRHNPAQAKAVRYTIDKLVEVGVYPPIRPGNPNSVYTMVEGWGAYWHVWTGTLACRHCGTDLRDHDKGPPFLRHTTQIVNDRVAYDTCPECKRVL